MSEATVRDLRNHGRQVLDRVEAGESVTITRDGKPVAQLEPLARARLSAAAVVERFVASRNSNHSGYGTMWTP